MDDVRTIMDKTITTNFDLEILTNALGIKTWIGMRDQFNSHILSQYNFFIINVQPNYMSGLHWCALHKKRQPDGKIKCIFFCPFGSNPMNEVTNACKKSNSKLFFSNNIYQHFKSNNCGFFCVAFLLSMAKNISFQTFSKIFSTEEKRNDRIVKRLITKELIKLKRLN